jgi:hypothetical protein
VKIRRKIGVAVVTGALVLLATAPASAHELTYWSYGVVANHGTYATVHIGTGNVTATEYGSGYVGSIAARCYWSPNSINYYNGTQDWDVFQAVGTCGNYGQAIKIDHRSW